jgi:Trk K+ transport system NAD-binding subunit
MSLKTYDYTRRVDEKLAERLNVSIIKTGDEIVIVGRDEDVRKYKEKLN